MKKCNKDCALPATNIGEVLIRCNNVLYLKTADEESEEGEMRD